MVRAIKTTGEALRDYMQELGWGLLSEAAKDRLYVLVHPSIPSRQLVFPMDDTAPDYRESIELCVEKLADIYKLTPSEVYYNICKRYSSMLLPPEVYKRLLVLALKVGDSPENLIERWLEQAEKQA